MIIKVGGCFGSESAGFHSAGFLVNGKLLLEGGTVTSAFSLEEQQSITDVIISHIHLDHTKELFFLLDNLAPLNSRTVTFHGVQEIVDGVRTYLFNEQLWPDFSRLPDIRSPILTFRVVPEGEFSSIGGLDVKPVRVNHTISATGYIFREGEKAVVYTGDTGPTEKIWVESGDEKNLQAIIVETSFPDSMEELALASGHLTPRLLERELDRLGRPEVPVYIFHMKPNYLEEISGEVRRLSRYRVEVLRQGETYAF